MQLHISPVTEQAKKSETTLHGLSLPGTNTSPGGNNSSTFCLYASSKSANLRTCSSGSMGPGISILQRLISPWAMRPSTNSSSSAFLMALTVETDLFQPRAFRHLYPQRMSSTTLLDIVCPTISGVAFKTSSGLFICMVTLSSLGIISIFPPPSWKSTSHLLQGYPDYARP